MENLIIIAVIALLIALSVLSFVKRAGRKGCCGSGGEYKPRKKKLKNIIATKTFTVEGMHCEKCSSRVTEAINDIPGLAAEVELKTGRVTVSYEQEVPDEQIRAKLERLGYNIA